MPIRLYDPIAIHTIVILMIQYDPMIVKLIENVQVCPSPGLDV